MLENQKPLSVECFKKSGPYHSISARVIWGQGQNALQPERASEEQTGRGRGLFIHIWTLHKRQALFTNQRLGIHIRIYNSFSMRRDCHSGGKIKDRERETRGWKKLFRRYRWWWSSASIWNQVFPSVSPEVFSVQQMNVTKPGADTTQIKCLKQNPTSTEELSKIPILVIVTKLLCTEAANDSWKCSSMSVLLSFGFLMRFLCKRQHTQSWWEGGARQSTVYNLPTSIVPVLRSIPKRKITQCQLCSPVKKEKKMCAMD